MSDEFFDADRDAGLYPPKGWGWYSIPARKQKLRRLLKKAIEDPKYFEPWMLREARLLGITIKGIEKLL